MAGIFGYSREAIRVKVKKCEGLLQPEFRKFSVDPQITSFEVLQSILGKAFDIKGEFTVCYRTFDESGHEIYLSILSDWELDAAFLRSHNISLQHGSEPSLCLRVDMKPFAETTEEWDLSSNHVVKPFIKSQRLPGLIMNQVERTFNMFQKALNLGEEMPIQPPRPPLSDSEFRKFQDPVGQIVHTKELRSVIYYGGIDPALRKVVWKHILNVYPEGMSGKARMDYMKRKAGEYIELRDTWKDLLKTGNVSGDLAYTTGMVRKDVLRTDRHHRFYAGNDDNQNIASLFNILTTYALNHPKVSYCQGMSDLASPLLVTMGDESHAYICFCALMKRLGHNFMLDGIAMTQKFTHLAEALLYYDPEFFAYLKSHQADDLLFCYRWLLLEMKREFAFEDSLRMLEVLWSSLPASPPEKELKLWDVKFKGAVTPPVSPLIKAPRENAYSRVCALRRQSSSISIASWAGSSKIAPSIKRQIHSLDETVSRAKDIQPALECTEEEPKLNRICASLDKLDEVEPEKKVVKNFNEFLNFAPAKSESPDDEYFPMTTSITRELRLELEQLDRHVFGYDAETKPKSDIFIWENPLHREPSPKRVTPDEYEGEIHGVKSTPIKLLRKECPRKIVEPVAVPTESDEYMLPVMTSSECEEAIENANRANSLLPPPKEFGGGNPFLMFLCVTLLLQHRNFVMENGMDYNEMAMHFDKMVRKHNVIRVLDQARSMFASYMKLHTVHNNNPVINQTDLNL